jgi:hypothetical protein
MVPHRSGKGSKSHSRVEWIVAGIRAIYAAALVCLCRFFTRQDTEQFFGARGPTLF